MVTDDHRVGAQRAPRADLGRAENSLRSRGAAPGADTRRFGRLSLRPWDLHQPPLAADLTALLRARPEWHEVGYVARRCVGVPIGPVHAPFRVEVRAAAGNVLHLRAGFAGERGYDREKPPALVVAYAGGAEVGRLEVPPIVDPEPAWRALDVTLPPGDPERAFAFSVSSRESAGRPFCLAAWTTR